MMDKLELTDMFKILKVEKHSETMYKIMDKIDPETRVELIKYLIEKQEGDNERMQTL